MPRLSSRKQKKLHEWCYEYARTCVNEARSVIEKLAERFPLQLVSNFYGNVDEVLRDFDIRKVFAMALLKVPWLACANPMLAFSCSVALHLA